LSGAARRLPGLQTKPPPLACQAPRHPAPSTHARPPTQAQTFWQRIRQLQEEDVPVLVTVVGANRGGLMVQYAHLEGFIPVSHLAQVRFPVIEEGGSAGACRRGRRARGCSGNGGSADAACQQASRAVLGVGEA
jgi:hypothetical protein